MMLMGKPFTRAMLTVMLLVSCFWSVALAAAQDTSPSGTVAITATSVAAGAGVQPEAALLLHDFFADRQADAGARVLALGSTGRNGAASPTVVVRRVREVRDSLHERRLLGASGGNAPGQQGT